MNRWPWRKILVVDFCAALFGTVAYYIGFDFMTIILELPHWLASTQLAANFLYAVFGFSIFVLRTQKIGWFKTLIAMNCLYALFCAVFSVVSFFDGAAWGALLLAVEALLISVLVIYENKSLKTSYR